jgi:hypothetical protein
VNNTPTRLKGGAGRAVAVSEQGRFGGKLGELPVVWNTPDAEPELLPLPDGYTIGEVVAFGDDERTVLGTIGAGRTTDVTRGDAVGTGVLWLPGGIRVLPLPAGATWVRPTAMRGGWVVGVVSDGSAFRYDVEADRIETLPRQITYPVGVSSDGAVAGLSALPGPIEARGYLPYLLVGGEARALRPDDPAGTLYQLTGLTDDGTVIGHVIPERGVVSGFVSTCD